jgi:sulfur transfer protein SufE
MAQAGFEDLVETFEFLDDWEERYRHVIELGKALPDMPEALKVPATKVEGCASQGLAAYYHREWHFRPSLATVMRSSCVGSSQCS